MAGETVVWEGGAAAIAQVDTVQITGYDAGTTYTLTVGDKEISVTGTTDADGTAAALSAAWNLSTEPEVAEITATVATDTVTLTSDTPGVSHTVTSSVAGAAGTIGAVTSSTANSGPNDAAVATNWSTNIVPAITQHVVFENSTVSCLYNIAAAADIATFTSKSTFTGTIGLPRNNPAGYVEYRPQYFHVGVKIVTVDIGQGSGNGSSRINVEVGDLDTANMAVNVSKAALPVVTGVPAFLFKMATQTSGNDVDPFVVNRGTVGIGFYAGDTAVVETLSVGFIESAISDSDVKIGDTVTALTTVEQSGGSIESESTFATFNQIGGSCTLSEDAAIGTVANLNNGNLFHTSTGTIAEVHVNGGAVFDLRRDGRSRTVSLATIYQGGAIYDPNKTVTWSADIDLFRCGLPDVTLDIGEHFTLGIGSI